MKKKPKTLLGKLPSFYTSWSGYTDQNECGIDQIRFHIIGFHHNNTALINQISLFDTALVRIETLGICHD